mgnify:CR=1 FL=1
MGNVPPWVWIVLLLGGSGGIGTLGGLQMGGGDTQPLALSDCSAVQAQADSVMAAWQAALDSVGALAAALSECQQP